MNDSTDSLYTYTNKFIMVIDSRNADTRNVINIFPIIIRMLSLPGIRYMSFSTSDLGPRTGPTEGDSYFPSFLRDS